MQHPNSNKAKTATKTEPPKNPQGKKSHRRLVIIALVIVAIIFCLSQGSGKRHTNIPPELNSATSSYNDFSAPLSSSTKSSSEEEEKDSEESEKTESEKDGEKDDSNEEKQSENSGGTYNEASTNLAESNNQNHPDNSNIYRVESVVDGDTIKVTYEGALTSVRLIGVNTPETVDPRKSVECFGREASNYLKQKLEGQTVVLEADASQTDRDKYNRLLRYVYLNGADVNLDIIQHGYGYEYTYNIPYNKQAEYKAAQAAAESNKAGLWADDACVVADSSTSAPASAAPAPQATPAPASSAPTNTAPASPAPQSTPAPASPAPQANVAPQNDPASCTIKGNISNSGEKIYHMPGQRMYNKTVIDTGAGERWFCSEAEAVAAGWRKSKV